jgi:NTE family protein
MTSHTLVLGGGGVTGIAWMTGLIAGLAEAGVELVPAASVIGTSAGATVAAQVTSGASLEQLYERQLAGVPYEITKSASALPRKVVMASLFSKTQEIAAAKLGKAALESKVGPTQERRSIIQARLPQHTWPDSDLRIVVVDAETGVARVVTRADQIPLIDAVAASCAVPLVWPAVKMQGRFYVDGGVRSPVNLDLAPGDGPVIALAPTTASVRKWGNIDAQRRSLGQRPVEIVTPSAEVKSAQGRNALDASTVPATARAGREQAREVFARLGKLVG